MNDSIPPLMRGAGGLILLVVAIIIADISSKADQAGDDMLRGIIRLDTSIPFASLTDAEKKERRYQVALNSLTAKVDDLHHDLQKRSLVSIVTKDRWLSRSTFLGSAFIVLSYFVEWLQKRKKGF